MKTVPLTAALVAAILALGAPALHAEVSPQSIADNLNAVGYSNVEITTGPTQVRAEGTNGTERIEVVYDRATGAILRQEQTRERSRTEVQAGVELHTSTQDFDTAGSDDHGMGNDDSGSDDHGGAGNDDSGSDDHGGAGSDDSGSDDHGGAGSDDSGSDDHGGSGGESDHGGSGHDSGDSADD